MPKTKTTGLKLKAAFVLCIAFYAIPVFAAETVLSFSGNGSYVDLGTPAALQIPSNDPFTIEGWMLFNALSTRDMLYCKNNGRSGATYTYMLGFSDNNLAAWDTTWRGNYPVSRELGRWYHVAFSFDGVNMSFYLDGNLLGTAGFNFSNIEAHTVKLGGYHSLYGDINGLESDVRVWNYARSQAEIQASMATRLNGDEPGLVGYWPMNDGAGDIAHDQSDPGGSDGNIVNGVWRLPNITYTWKAPAGGNWNSAANWLPEVSSPFADVKPSSGDSVVFETAGSGAINTLDIPLLSLAEYRQIEGEHTLDMNTLSLTSATFTVNGIGEGTNALLNITDGSLHILDELSIGMGQFADGHVALSPNVALQIGTETNRALLQVGHNNGDSSSYADASLIAGNTFNAWLTDCSIGWRDEGYTSGDTRGLLDLSAVTEHGVLDIAGDTRIGWHRFAEGAVLISDAIDVRIGSAQNRGGFLDISNILNGNRGQSSSLVMGTGRFDAYITSLSVSAGDADGLLDAANVSEGVLDISGHVHIASVYARQGTVVLSDNIRVKIGDPDTRSEFIIAGASGAKGYFTTGANTFEAYLGTVTLAQGATASETIAELNLGNVTNGILDIAGDIQIGYNRNTFAAVDLSPAFTTIIGDPDARVIMAIGGTDRWRDVSFTAGGTFHAYLTDLFAGRRTTTYTTPGHAVLDLSGVTNGTLNVENEMIVCSGLSDGRATVKLPAIPAATDRLVVGDTTHADAYGLLELNGTPLSVSGSVLIDGPSVVNQGVIDVTVFENPAGLDLADAATLIINQGKIAITFQQPPQHQPQAPFHYWGLRWEGDHVAELEALRSAGKLEWDDTNLTDLIIEPVAIYKDQSFTYVGPRLGWLGSILTSF